LQEDAIDFRSEPDESSPVFFRSILILSSHSRVGTPGNLISSGLPTKTLYAFLFSPLHATRPAHLIFLDVIIIIIFGYDDNF
jgi:hypothetical protein